MSDLKQKNYAYREAIKCIGIGKKGSRDMPVELVNALIEEKRSGQVPDEAWGALLGAFSVKGLSEEEKVLNDALSGKGLKDPAALIDHLVPDLNKGLKDIFKKLITQQILDEQEAGDLAAYIFDPSSSALLKGMAASIMRVRYETAEEYKGILSFLRSTYAKEFTQRPPEGKPIVQFAEPFDGVDHSHIITPAVIARLAADVPMRAVSLCGRNSGPKLFINLFDIAKELNATFLNSSQDLRDAMPAGGYYLDQAKLSPAMDRWVDIRRTIIKRPFLSTLERFVDPFNADILIASAFHPPYGEKMLKTCEDQDCKAAIIVRNGIEGGIAFPLLRNAKILVTKRVASKTYERCELEFDSKKELGHSLALEERVDEPKAADNVKLIKNYLNNKSSGHNAFNIRVEATSVGLRRAVDWIMKG